MPIPRASLREKQDARNVKRKQDMDDAVASGNLVVRQMTPAERAESDARLSEFPARTRPRRFAPKPKPQ
jgi:hypothetical protein